MAFLEHIARGPAKTLALIKRAQALAELMQDKVVIAVAGSHGKTTTSSLCSLMLIDAGLRPTVAVGGILKNIEANAYSGDGDYFVAEADESDGSFLYYKPAYSIITNIDREHLDYYGDFSNEVKAFGDFVNNTLDEGCVFYCADDPILRELLKDSKKRKVMFGLNPYADIYPANIKIHGLRSEFDVFYRNQFIATFNLSLGGEHNISNALSVIALGLELEIDADSIKNTFLNFKGAARRLEVKFENEDLMVVDDYAHHPSEIKASLAALKNLGRKRIIAIFQPHRYTRTQNLLDEFASCFAQADYLILTDIYSAGEPSIPGVNAQLLLERIKEYSASKEVAYLPKDEIIKHILKIRQPQDLVVTLGAGDIVKVSDELAQRVE
ncbi:MAG: UDP-N-acetylmuramate--L-alanine ligase [Candidatus Omnitrophica bacterium]|nr:UDP-N-acetylmuramate--L-alanine ligase [Candidatus Omnitrophota bacterium]